MLRIGSDLQKIFVIRRKSGDWYLIEIPYLCALFQKRNDIKFAKRGLPLKIIASSTGLRNVEKLLNKVGCEVR